MPYASTILELLERGRPDAVAIGAPGRAPVTFAGLRAQVGRVITALNERGIGRNDPVGIVLSNGPEMATAFVSIASAATTAPLNPVYRLEEFEFYLSDLGARLLIVEAGAESPARDAAARLGVAVVDLIVPPEAPAGVFDLSGGDHLAPARAGAHVRATGHQAHQQGPAEPDDVALVLHTSGTTARPKIVPLSHRNVCASADHVAASLALTAGDRCLNIMPLFHIHGLVAAVLGSLAAGASVWCTPGFNALSFFAWMKEIRPTWYTAVPTMHQAILGRSSRNREVIEQGQLRLVRSSSASLPPQVMSELEAAFGVPVIEAYGMTEAAHQMASNPLPPRPRAPGSVGVAAGPEIAILDEHGRRLPQGATGEVAIRGPNVTSGYQNNPAANAAAFMEGWFRTGDQGVIDDSGYLRLTGRLKEIINRGGEKISPREIDEVLLDHPAVAQAVTFALPHDKLGEAVAAALVLKEGVSATEDEIRQFTARRLADFKVPSRIVFLQEIPKGPTGKPQRIGLAKRLGLS